MVKPKEDDDEIDKDDNEDEDKLDWLNLEG